MLVLSSIASWIFVEAYVLVHTSTDKTENVILTYMKDIARFLFIFSIFILDLPFSFVKQLPAEL